MRLWIHLRSGVLPQYEGCTSDLGISTPIPSPVVYCGHLPTTGITGDAACPTKRAQATQAAQYAILARWVARQGVCQLTWCLSRAIPGAHHESARFWANHDRSSSAATARFAWRHVGV